MTVAERLDSSGFGPHSQRRANITWRQEELTRRIQDRRAKAAKKTKDRKVIEMMKEAVA